MCTSTTLSDSQPQPISTLSGNQFDDLDAFARAIKPLNITVNQLTPGSFLGTVKFADFGHLKFTYVDQNQAFQAIGPKSSDHLAFAIALEADRTPIITHGSLITKQDLFGFNSDQETDIITGANSPILFASVNLELFQSLSEQMGYDCFGRNFLQQNCIRFHPNSLRILKDYYQEISQILNRQPLLLMLPQMQSLIVEDFCPLLIDTLGKIANKKLQRIKIYSCYSLIKKAEEIAQSYVDQPLTLQKLCDELGTSTSTLSYGFQNIFQISPMAYLKIQRLNGVRHALKNADPKTTTVMSVAQKWGFWSGGHFSRNYKEMFGELPSKTLRRQF